MKRKVEHISAGSVDIVLGGDLLEDSQETVLAHQANCESRGARGLAAVVFKKWPNANIYAKRKAHSTPGGIEARDCGDRVVVGLFAQRSPGGARAGDGDDSAPARLRWFEESLDGLGALMAARGAAAVAMPFNVGCGLAGGKWADYRARVDAFAERYKVAVKLYDLDRASLGPSAPGATAGDGPTNCVGCGVALPPGPAWKLRCFGCYKARRASGK